jgi:hypothetical protein
MTILFMILNGIVNNVMPEKITRSYQEADINVVERHGTIKPVMALSRDKLNTYSNDI